MKTTMHKIFGIFTLLGLMLVSGSLLAMDKKDKEAKEEKGTKVESLAVEIESLLAQGNEATRNNNLAAAKKAYNRLHNLFQGDYSSYYNLGQLYNKAKDVKNAKAHFEEALARNPLNADTHLQLTLIAQQEQNAAAFQAHAQEFLRLDPDSKLAPEVAKVLIQSFGMKDLQRREGGWMTGPEVVLWKKENDRWTQAFPMGQPIAYLMKYNRSNRWRPFEGQISVTLESVTMRFGTPVATFLLTENYESDRFNGYRAEERLRVLVEPSGAIPVLVADQLSYLTREGRTLMSHNVFLLGEEAITSRSFVGWEAGDSAYQDSQVWSLPLKGYENLNVTEKTAIFGGVGVAATEGTLQEIAKGGGMMVPAGRNSEITEFFSAFLMARNVTKEHNYPVVGEYKYPHRAGANVSKWGVDFTGTVLVDPNVTQASHGGGRGTNLGSGSSSNRAIRGESVSEEFYSSQYPFYFDKKKVQMLEETQRKVDGMEKMTPVRHYEVEGLDLFIDKQGRPVEYTGSLFSIKEQR